MFSHLFLASFRWHLINNFFQINHKTYFLYKLVLIGHFFNQLLPSTIGGDGIRALILSKLNVPLKKSFYSVIIDRIYALVILTFISALSLLILYYSFKTINLVIYTSLIIFLLIIVFLICIKLILSINFFKDNRILSPIYLFTNKFTSIFIKEKKSFSIFCLTFFSHFFLFLSLYYISCSLGIFLNIEHFLIFPISLLLSAIPISFAGWGIREGVFVFCMGMFGISSTDAFLLSVLYGLVFILASIPGLYFFIILLINGNIFKKEKFD